MPQFPLMSQTNDSRFSITLNPKSPGSVHTGSIAPSASA